VSDADLDRLYRTHAALLFCGVEDFGIVPVEAIARGCPVVALGSGGATETIESGTTGVLFEEATVDNLLTAIRDCDEVAWDREHMHARSQRFSAEVFPTPDMKMNKVFAFSPSFSTRAPTVVSKSWANPTNMSSPNSTEFLN
jgi:glycosyltransferase involved in cell wall biosynthesis